MQARGGSLRIEWDGQGSVFMTGPATAVFDGNVDL
jgi:diaminopimelate epimerase